jgi:hypothetical protein
MGNWRLVETLPQQSEEALPRHRRRDQNALPEIAAHHQQGLQIHRSLDAFGDRGAAEAMGEIDGGLTDRRIVRDTIDARGSEVHKKVSTIKKMSTNIEGTEAGWGARLGVLSWITR